MTFQWSRFTNTAGNGEWISFPISFSSTMITGYGTSIEIRNEICIAINNVTLTQAYMSFLTYNGNWSIGEFYAEWIGV